MVQRIVRGHWHPSPVRLRMEVGVQIRFRVRILLGAIKAVFIFIIGRVPLAFCFVMNYYATTPEFHSACIESRSN